MTRTIISIDAPDKQWLEQEAKRSGRSKAEIVRIAIRQLREAQEKSVDEVLQQTSGTWLQGDGLAYQRRLRSEWK